MHNKGSNVESDLLIKNGLILTLDSEDRIITDGYVTISDGIITGVGHMSELDPGATAKKVTDAGSGLVMPGLINAHTHAAMSCFRGLADDLPLFAWLNEHIFPAEAAHVNEDLVYWGTKLSCAEMLLSGTTCVADGYFLEDQTARAVHEAGLRAVLAQGVIDFPAPGVPDPKENILAAEEYIHKWQRVSPLIGPSVFCHSPYTCSPETLIRTKELARANGAIFQIHAAETADEVEQVRRDHGTTPVRFLDKLGVLDESTLAIHCVHLDEEELDLLAERGTAVAVCLESNMKLGAGLVKLPEMIDRGVRVALGTDGPASNNDLSLFGEMRAAALIYKAVRLDPTVLPASSVLSLATAGGADVLGLSGQIGILAIGAKADIIILDLLEPNLTPMYNPTSHLVYAATGREVRMVLVEGDILVENGRLTKLDLDEAMARVREIAERIK